MLPLAHIGTAVLLSKATHTSTPHAIAGALAPDLLDKPPAWVLGLTPSGRYLGHSLLSAGALSLAIARFSGWRAGGGFAAGYVGHLLDDADGLVPWLMPFKRYPKPVDPHFHLQLTPRIVAREAFGLAIILVFAARARRSAEL